MNKKNIIIYGISYITCSALGFLFGVYVFYFLDNLWFLYLIFGPIGFLLSQGMPFTVEIYIFCSLVLCILIFFYVTSTNVKRKKLIVIIISVFWILSGALSTMLFQALSGI